MLFAIRCPGVPLSWLHYLPADCELKKSQCKNIIGYSGLWQSVSIGPCRECVEKAMQSRTFVLKSS